MSKIRKRADAALRLEGQSLSGWRVMVLEKGLADQVNAAAWSGGIITINRPLVELCFQIASVSVNSRTPAQLDRELWRLSRWRKDKKNLQPESLSVSQSALGKRDAIAESILSHVLLHEMGHASSGHVELKDRPRAIVVPGQVVGRRDPARSMELEREADQFATVLGAKGGARLAGVMPLFSYYNFLSRPTFSERGKHAVADWRSHPLDAERYNNSYKILAEAKLTKSLPLPLAPRIILPSGQWATPDKQAEVVPIRRPQAEQPAQRVAAAR